MRTCKWIVAPFLLIALSAMAQETAGQLPSSPTPSAQSVISTPAPQPTTPMPAAQAQAARRTSHRRSHDHGPGCGSRHRT